MKSFRNVFEPGIGKIKEGDHELKGQWGEKVFGNDHPIVLELGCGKGEYTIGLAEKFSDKNFIGVDIKGARIWKGAKYIHENKTPNAAFLRTRVEFIEKFFAPGEIHEIWLTFPDPQEKIRRRKKRLSGPVFLNAYSHFLVQGGIIHLKTDNDILYRYTRLLVQKNSFRVLQDLEDLYASGRVDDILDIKTFYERMFLEEGKKIYYLKFALEPREEILEPDEDI